MKYDVALKTAEALVGHLQSACVRIEIAGSIRREKPEVKDIEIVAIPDSSLVVPRAKLEFGKPIPPVHKTMLDRMIAEMQDEDAITIEKNGDRLKQFYLKYAGINVDLFINIPPSHWGIQMVIRTGSKDFSHWCVTEKRLGGALPNGHFVKHQVLWVKSDGFDKYQVPDVPKESIGLLTSGNHLSMPEEIDFLKFLELGWIEPKERVARWK